MSSRLHLFFFSLLFVMSAASDSAAATLPGDNGIGLSAGAQQSPAISGSGNSTLVVWSDGRANPYGSYEYETGKDIYGMRLDAAGKPLDVLPIPIVVRQANQENPKVVWNGSNWLVVYESYDVHGAGYYYQKSLEAVRVSPAGQVLDSKPIHLYGLIPTGVLWDVASDGNNWVVVNEGTAATGDVIAVRVSSSGVVLDPPTTALVKATYYSRSNFNLAYAGGVFFLTFNDDYNNGLYNTSAVRFDSNLQLLTPTPVGFLNGPIDDLTGNGTQFFAVWNQQLPDYSMAVTCTRVGTNGQKLDGAGKNISGNFPNGSYDIISSAWDGVNWRVTWGNNNAVRTARISTSGTVLDPGGIPLAGLMTGPIAGSGNGGIQLAWTLYSNNDYDIRSSNISSTNLAGTVQDLSVGTPQQVFPDVAASGSGYMIVFRSNTSAQRRVFAQPLDSSGNSLTTQPIQLDVGDSTTGPGQPNVAWNGSLYLVAWGNANGVVAQRLLPNGTKVDSVPFVVMNPGFGPADVAALGSDFLVAARKSGYTPQYIFAIAARVRGSDGAVLDTVPLTLNSTYARAPAVTTLGGQWFVAFHNNWTHDNSTADTNGSFVSSGGAITNLHIHGPFSTAGGNGIFEVGLASSGNVALMVQSQELTSGVENDLLARTISSGGIVGPVVNLAPWPGNQYRPRAAWDGKNFVIVYQDQKNRLALQTLDQLDARSDLFGMRVSETGSKVDPQGFVFSALPTSETDPTIASMNGISLVAGSVMMNQAGLASYRISYGRFGLGGNQWPVAVITPSTTSGDVSLPVNFQSTGSFDPDGSIVSYSWNFGDGLSSTSPNPSHTFSTPGERLTTLIVTDNLGAQTSQAIMINATAPNQLPIAVASANKTSGNAPLDVIFYADGSYDPDGFTGNLEWLFSDGATYYGSPAYHTITQSGIFTATLRVYDSRGGIGVDTVSINITGVNQPPVANASAVPSTGSVPLTVAFSSAGSSDPDGAITGYHWDFGNAMGSANTANPTYVYSYPGSYTATLTVTDNNNISASDSVLITVNQPSASVIRSSAITLSGTTRAKKVTVTGKVTVLNGSNAPVSGATVSVQWTGPGGSTATQTTTTNTSGVASFSTSGGKGTYTLTVKNITKTGCTFDAVNSVLTKSITQ